MYRPPEPVHTCTAAPHRASYRQRVHGCKTRQFATNKLWSQVVSKFNIDAEKLKKAAPAYTEMQAPLPLLRGFGLWARLRPLASASAFGLGFGRACAPTGKRSGGACCNVQTRTRWPALCSLDATHTTTWVRLPHVHSAVRLRMQFGGTRIDSHMRSLLTALRCSRCIAASLRRCTAAR